ncbi:MAG TPA: hypothetical protein VIL74_22890 [Pyrinomonadaceae bacterium]
MKAEMNEENSAQVEPTEESSHELRLPVWSVISFDKREAGNLTYPEAEQKLAALEGQKVSGLCIVPDEVAARLPEKN